MRSAVLVRLPCRNMHCSIPYNHRNGHVLPHHARPMAGLLSTSPHVQMHIARLRAMPLQISRCHHVLCQLGEFSQVIVIVALFMPIVCPVGGGGEGYVGMRPPQHWPSSPPRSHACPDNTQEKHPTWGPSVRWGLHKWRSNAQCPWPLHSEPPKPLSPHLLFWFRLR